MNQSLSAANLHTYDEQSQTVGTSYVKFNKRCVSLQSKYMREHQDEVKQALQEAERDGKKMGWCGGFDTLLKRELVAKTDTK